MVWGCNGSSLLHPTCLLPLVPLSLCRWLYLALQHPAWTPQQHRRFMPAFRKAAATLLLAARRGARQASGSSDGDGDGQSPAAMLGALPHELLLHIIGLAAYPLSAWAPLDLASQCPQYRPPARPA